MTGKEEGVRITGKEEEEAKSERDVVKEREK